MNSSLRKTERVGEKRWEGRCEQTFLKKFLLNLPNHRHTRRIKMLLRIQLKLVPKRIQTPGIPLPRAKQCMEEMRQLRIGTFLQIQARFLRFAIHAYDRIRPCRPRSLDVRVEEDLVVFDGGAEQDHGGKVDGPETLVARANGLFEFGEEFVY